MTFIHCLICLICLMQVGLGFNETKKIGKRLETIEGVEIASSYKEYMDLALSDLEDRLNKSRVKLSDIRDRIEKRKLLFSEIKEETERRKEMAREFIEKDKKLRAKLLRNTEMKRAITNLADIAEYKLTSKNNLNDKIFENNSLLFEINNTNAYFNNIKSISIDDTNNSNNNKEMNKTYIEMAYNEINNILEIEKKTLMKVIRKKLTNDFKLKELENLKLQVVESLKRLEDSEIRLSQLIEHDNGVDDILKQLKSKLSLDSEEKRKLLSIIGIMPREDEIKN